MMNHSSQPKGACLLEERYQFTADMRSHDVVKATEQLTSHKDGGHSGRPVANRIGAVVAVATQVQAQQHLLNVGPLRVLVELMDGWPHSQVAQQPLHHMAHAAAALAEHHHRILRHQPLHQLHCARHPLLLLPGPLALLPVIVIVLHPAQIHHHYYRMQLLALNPS
jgi:hypothetical protein